MNKKTALILKIALSIVIILAIMIPSVAAQRNQGLFGDVFDRLTVTIEKLLTYNIHIVHPYPSGYSDETVPLWAVFAVFTLLFAIFNAAAARIPIFKDAERKGARTAFSVAITLIVIFGTPFTELMVVTFATYVTSLTTILLVLGFIVGLVWVFRLIGRGWGEGTKYSGKSREIAGEGRKLSHDAFVEKKDLRRSKRAYRKLHSFLKDDAKSIGNLKEHLIKIREMLHRLRSVSEHEGPERRPEALREAKEKVAKELGGLVPLVEKERRIDEKARHLTDKIQRLNIHGFKLTKKEGGDFKSVRELIGEVKRRHPGHKDVLDENRLTNFFNKLIQDERYIMQATNRIREMEAEFARASNQLKDLVEKASIEVHGNSFPQADNTIAEALAVLEGQNRLIQEMEEIDARIERIVRQEFKIENHILREAKEEVELNEQEIKTIQKEGAYVTDPRTKKTYSRNDPHIPGYLKKHL